MNMSTYCLLASICLVTACVQIAFAKECKKPCPACSATPTCAPGVSLVPDECGCCKTCARQLHEPCNSASPCDHHKELYCSYGDVDEAAGMCVAKPGRACYLDKNTYLNGESFTRGCKFMCTCIDSDIGCAPLCPMRVQIPRNCEHPRLIKKPGQCCEEWTCIKSSSKPEIPKLRQQLDSRRKNPFYHQKRPFEFAAARRGSEISLSMRTEDECMIQTTQWSACSKTCGWGVSERVTNDNKACKLRKEARLCQIRPCDTDFTTSIKKGKKCVRSPKATKPVRYSFSGCKSKVYTPKYCGSCVDGRCCTPERTKTVSITFSCDDGFSFKKRMMQIKSCSCRRKCAGSSDNDILNSHRGVGVTGDTWKE